MKYAKLLFLAACLLLAGISARQIDTVFGIILMIVFYTLAGITLLICFAKFTAGN